MVGSLTPPNATRGLDYPEFVRFRKQATPTDIPASTQPVGKGRPTPKRRDAEAARIRPMVTSRKDSVRERRADMKARRQREYQAQTTGDERNMPREDKGPVRRWVRDYVDARRNLGEYMMPLAFVLLAALLFARWAPLVAVYLVVGGYALIFAAVVDLIVLSSGLKKRLHAKFGAERIPRGTITYGLRRAIQTRRLRLPKPQVQRGDHPH
jgi:Protein of unknown function (DUF3043)